PYRGNRPSFIEAAPPVRARELYRFFIQELKQKGITVAEGVFQANMAVHLTNDGPVTIWIDSRDRFLKS
ncbi:MAG: D-aminoacyl-tRNA deacylase, partial [Thermoguttaceae bacterium]|nr:D-aminoacyl-tRNA deacylase [Thermoguttaceae bacterium]